MKRRFFKPVLCLLLTGAMLFWNTAAAGATETMQMSGSTGNIAAAGTVTGKEEVLYGLLDAAGAVQTVYAVNALEVTEAGTVTDFGAYDTVKNLTDTGEIVNENGAVTMQADKGRFYYQGTLQTKQLPWTIHIAYALDGQAIAPDELAGQSGDLVISIQTARNQAANAVFYENYLLQISLTLATDTCSQITAPGATVASAGADKMVTFTVLPGTNGDLSVLAKVDDFEMDGISISAVPYTMEIDIGDTSEWTDGIETLAAAVGDLNDGVKTLQNGAVALQQGIDELSTGGAVYQSGVQALADESETLRNGSAQILAALQEMEAALPSADELDLSALQSLPEGLATLSGTLSGLSEQINALSDSYATALAALDNAIAAIPDTAVSDEELAALQQNNPDSAALSTLLETYQAAQAVKAVYTAVSPAFTAVQTTLPQFAAALKQMGQTLQTAAGEMQTVLSQADGLSDLLSGLQTLQQQYAVFDEGLAEYTAGVQTVSDSYSALQAGLSGVQTGAGELTGGMQTFSNGLSQLNDNTAALPQQLGDAIEQMTKQYSGAKFSPVSFVSEKNQNVTAVQFVLQTAAIQKPVKTVTQTPKEKETFWDQLQNLFS